MTIPTLLPIQYQRQNAEPIDVDSVFQTTAERIDYLTNPRRYAGQVVADLEDGLVYVLDAAGTAWLPMGGGGDPGGADTQVQFNDGGAFGGSQEFTYTETTATVGLRNIANATTSVNVLVGTTTADAWASTYTDTVPPPVPFDLGCGLTQTITASSSDGYTLSNLGPPDPPETKYLIDNGYVIYTVNGNGTGALGDSNLGTSGYGLRFDPTGKGNYGPDDYIQPGNPWEGFGLQVNGVTIATGSNSSRSTTESWNTWNAGDNLIVAKPDLDPATQGVFVVQYQTVGNEPVIRIKMSYTNSTTAPVTVKMIRGVDPDIDNFQYNEYDTLNWRGLGTISGNDITYGVGTYSEKPLAIYAPGNGYTHNTGVVSDWPTYNFDYVLGGPEDGGNGSYFDYAICAAWDCSVVAPGETATVCVYYICSQTESEILGYITGSAPVQYTPDFDTGAVAIDSSGASYCAGVDSYTGNIFITKFNSTGTLVWQKSLAGIGGKYCNTIKIDSAGNIYVAVNYDTIPGTIVLKINTSLSIEWQTDILDGTNRIAIQNMQLDNSGNLWILASDSDNEAYAHLLKLDSSGTILWQKVISDAGFNVVAQDLILTPTGATVLINSFSVGVYKPTLLNYSSTGTLIDQITVVDPLAILFTNRNNLAVDSTGATYILQRWATTQNYVILTKIVLGAIEWQKKVIIPNGSDLRSSGVHVDQSDNVYISLARDDFADNISALYILKFSSVGTLIWSNGFTATNGVYYNFEGYKNNIAVGSNYFTVVGYIGATGGGYLSLAVHMPLDGNGWGSNDGFSYGPIDALISTPSVFTVSTGTMSDGTASLTGGTIVLTIDTLANSRNLVVFSGKSDWNFNPDGSTSLPNYTLPANDGLDGQILTTDGSGTLTWVPKEIDPATPVDRGSIFGYTTANSNVHIGYCSGNIAQTGNDNIAIGYQSLQCNTYGNGNTAIGCRAMQQNRNGTCNTAVGNFSLKCNCNGSYNVAVGDCALLKNLAGDYNTALGKGSLQGIIGTGYNVGVGFEAGRCVTTGGNNTIIGSLPGTGGLTCTVLVGAGTCERIKVDSSGLYINGACWCSGGASVSAATPTSLGTVFGYTTSNGNVSVGCCAGNTTQAGCNNIAIGCCTLSVNTTGSCNIAIGFCALRCTWGRSNVAIGAMAAANNSDGRFNVAIGECALNCNVGVSHNIAIGYGALQCSNAASDIPNIAIGKESLRGNTTGLSNIGIGTSSLRNFTTGIYNLGIGASALTGSAGAFGCGNIALGALTLTSVCSGCNNIAFGLTALRGITNANNNIAQGYQSQYYNITGQDNVSIGIYSLNFNYTGSNNIAIGTCSLKCNYSNNNIGIGTCAGCLISTGTNNTVIGNLTGAAGCVCTVLIGAGTCERVKVDNSGLYVNGTLFSVAQATPTSLGTVYACTTTTTCSNVFLGVCSGHATGDLRSSNVAIGASTLSALLEGSDNTALGIRALNCMNTGYWNVAVGSGALQRATAGYNNVAVGFNAMCAATAGGENVAIGYRPLTCNGSGCYNIALGTSALYGNTSGTSNFASGLNSLSRNTIGSNNIGLGTNSLNCNTTGNSNIAIGVGAGASIITGSNNTVIGSLSAAAGCVCTLLLGAGACERVKVDNTGLYINGSTLAVGTSATPTVSGTVLGYTTGNGNISVGCCSGNTTQTGLNNVAIGLNALVSNTTGNNNVAIGNNGLNLNTIGSNNIAMGGCNVLSNNTTGCNNIAQGTCALKSNTTGSDNIAQGYRAMCMNVTGSCNIAIGSTALSNNYGGNFNIALGSGSLYTNRSGGSNIAMGCLSLYSNCDGSRNISFGDAALRYNTGGNDNIAIGNLALCSLGTPTTYGRNNNIAIGCAALTRNTPIILGSSSIAIGAGAGCDITTGVENTVIGRLAGSAGLVCTVLIGAGTCERLRIDNSGISVNGALLSTTLQGDGLSSTSVGFRIVPQTSKSVDYTLVASDSSKHIYHPASDANSRTFTIPSNASVPFPIGTSITFVNDSILAVTIAITGDALVLAGTGASGSRTLAQYGFATALKVDTTLWYISGANIT